MSLKIGRADIKMLPDENLYLGKQLGKASGYASRAEAVAAARTLSGGSAPAALVARTAQDRFSVFEVRVSDADYGGATVGLGQKYRPEHYRSLAISNPAVLDVVDGDKLWTLKRPK